MQDAMPTRTIFLSRLIGLYCILIPLAMAVHRHASLDMVTALMNNAPLLFLVALIAVTTGLAMVLGHNVWSGGPLPVIVTVIGWIALIKGLLLLFLSPKSAARFFLGGLRCQRFFLVYAGASIILGICLVAMSAAPQKRGGAA
jgi:hypothetical protein